jgi:hypothetical protein
MPCAEPFHRFNRLSVRFNGLSQTGATKTGGREVASAFASNEPPTDIDFSALGPPPPFVLRDGRSIEQLVRTLLDPPPQAFVHGVVSINWVLGVVGCAHFRYRETDGRFVITETSSLRVRGRELGLPAAYYGWLCGDDVNVSAAEEGMLLTAEFFQKEI